VNLVRSARRPASQQRIRLTLKWLVFEDQFGNHVLVDPARNKPLWLDETRRPPSVYVAATDVEMHRALEEMLECYQRVARVTSQHVDLVDKVQTVLEARFCKPKEDSAKRAA
jgi:hypothetical protein